MSGQSDADIAFDELYSLLKRFGFQMHFHQRWHGRIINLQPVNTKAKPYQVKQVRNLLRAYRFDEDNE
jgi:hypothetical protein